MKLFHSPASPFVRKVRVAAKLRGLDGRIELMPSNPHLSPPELLAANPLSKIPALLCDDGTALIDSLVICEYLDTLGDAPRLIPTAGPARVAALNIHAIANGIMDAAVARRGSAQLPQDEGRQKFDARTKAAVDRALTMLEAMPPAPMDITGATIGCALGYLDFRFAHEPWRAAHPKLAAWFETANALPAFAETMPVG
ncbi:MAG: glutathione S-transferase [Alphaproteobacteria bacterium]|nr:glutathione S-transferase [Alphaproteobacteria bacterium]